MGSKSSSRSWRFYICSAEYDQVSRCLHWFWNCCVEQITAENVSSRISRVTVSYEFMDSEDMKMSSSLYASFLVALGCKWNNISIKKSSTGSESVLLVAWAHILARWHIIPKSIVHIRVHFPCAFQNTTNESPKV